MNYKNFTIRSTPRYLLHAELWKLTIAIPWERGGGMTSRQFSVEITSPTEQEADVRGVTFGQWIIDGRVLGMSVN